MPEFITLPTELIFKVFGHLDHIGTATKLSRTCRRMHDAWHILRSDLSMALVPHHPLFWEFPERDASDQPITSLWQYALDYENAIPVSDEDGFNTAKRIIEDARIFRTTARILHRQMSAYAEGKSWFQHEEKWRRYGQYTIARMLYVYITRSFDGGEYLRPGPNGTIGDTEIFELADLYDISEFANRHRAMLPDGFPDWGETVATLDSDRWDRYINNFSPAVILGIEKIYRNFP